MSEQMEVIRLNVRISDLEASVLFWKKDAIAGTTRIRNLEAALREIASYQGEDWQLDINAFHMRETARAAVDRTGEPNA